MFCDGSYVRQTYCKEANSCDNSDTSDASKCKEMAASTNVRPGKALLKPKT